MRLQGRNGQRDIRFRLGDIDGLSQLHGTFPTGVIVAQFDAVAAAPEQIRHQNHVAVGSVLLCNRADVFVDAENFLDQDDAGALTGMRDGQVSAEGTVGCLDVDPFGGNAHDGSSLCEK